nr:MAG TPA: hypothetical protein [Caudoviricetes sp.]
MSTNRTRLRVLGERKQKDMGLMFGIYPHDFMNGAIWFVI